MNKYSKKEKENTSPSNHAFVGARPGTGNTHPLGHFLFVAHFLFTPPPPSPHQGLTAQWVFKLPEVSKSVWVLWT